MEGGALKDVALIFEPITSLVSREHFNPWPLYYRYRNRGIPNRYIAEAIVDGFVDAFTHHSEEHPMEKFGGYCTMHCKGKIHELRRQLQGVYRNNRQTFIRKTQIYMMDPAHYNHIPESAKQVVPSKKSYDLPELVGVDAKGLLSQLISRAIPLEEDGKVSKMARALFLHYVLGDSWVKVAEKMGMKSRQLAQRYGKLGEDMLIAFTKTDEGRDCLKRIMAEFGGLSVFDEDAEYNDPGYIKEPVTVGAGIPLEVLFRPYNDEDEDEVDE